MLNERKGIALIRIGEQQLCIDCASETDWQEIDGADDVITDQQIERRACMVFCDRCGKIVNQ